MASRDAGITISGQLRFRFPTIYCAFASEKFVSITMYVCAELQHFTGINEPMEFEDKNIIVLSSIVEIGLPNDLFAHKIDSVDKGGVVFIP